MRTACRPSAVTRRSRLLVRSCTVAGLAVVLSAPGAAIALFSAAPAPSTIGVTAATISSPTGFTATVTSSTAVSLSWTAPPALTGFTLSQSPGTLAGCSATPSASTTSCTATGLSPGTAYTWTLTALYNNWKSSPVQAAGTTSPAVGATLLGTETDTSLFSQSSTVTGVTTTSGAALLILVYRQALVGNLGVNSISGTAIGGTPSQVSAQTFSSGGVKYLVAAWTATGTGLSGGTVTVGFTNTNFLTTTTIDVVQLSGVDTTSPVVQAATSTASSATTATGGALPGASPSDGEVFFAGLSEATTMSTPGGYTALDAPAAGSSALYAAWFSPSASSSGVVTTLGTSSTYGTIEIEVGP
jgi:Fibronectin type III domain